MTCPIDPAEDRRTSGRRCPLCRNRLTRDELSCNRCYVMVAIAERELARLRKEWKAEQ